MINFCTLFDSNYLSRGLALYHSLQKVSSSFHLYVVAFDDKCYQYLKGLGLPSLTPISLFEFENEELLKVKPSRTIAEYCWTCTPSIIYYCIEKYSLPDCTYIDSDMIFYSDPKPLLDEMQQKSILITSHRYTAEYDSSNENGIYCVQFVCFKNNPEGMSALTWWRDRCIEWCHAYLEDGKFGDQKYMDDWPSRFNGTHVLEHLGGGIAPWNVQQYEFTNNDERLTLINKKDGREYPVVFFHYHGLKYFTDNVVQFTASLYYINKKVKELFYIPYTNQLMRIKSDMEKQSIAFDPHGARKPSPAPLSRLTDYFKELFFLSENIHLMFSSSGILI